MITYAKFSATYAQILRKFQSQLNNLYFQMVSREL